MEKWDISKDTTWRVKKPRVTTDEERKAFKARLARVERRAIALPASTLDEPDQGALPLVDEPELPELPRLPKRPAPAPPTTMGGESGAVEFARQIRQALDRQKGK